MTCAEFIRRFVRVPVKGRRGLQRMAYHPEQARLIEAVDARDAAGLRAFRELVISWIKKAGKSTTLAAIALYALVGDDMNGEDREVIIGSSDLAQSKDITFMTAARMVERDRWLSQHCKVTGTEIVFTETRRHERTGGTYRVSHVLRAVPRDPKGLHGQNNSCTILDEFWTQDDVALAEALSPSPWRPSPLTVYASYAGLTSQQRAGVPLYDLLQRARAGEDPTLFLSELRGPDAWRQVPWIDEAWVNQQRRALPPARFARMVENRPGAAEAQFLSADAIADATRDHQPDVEPNPAVSYVAGIDLGLSRDWAAMVIGHVDGLTRFVVDVVETWRPTRERRLSLVAVEDAIRAWLQRYHVRAVRLDQWQAVAFAERLKLAGVARVECVALGQGELDKLATVLKSTFVNRLITIPIAPPELREQLEALGEEEMKRRNSKRDLVRFQHARGDSAAGHDDIATALSLALQVAQGEVGVPVLPPQTTCPEAERPYGNRRAVERCYLLGGPVVVHGLGCQTCPGRQASEAQYQAWRTRQVEAAGTDADRQAVDETDVRAFTAQFMKPSVFAAARRLERSVRQVEGYL